MRFTVKNTIQLDMDDPGLINLVQGHPCLITMILIQFSDFLKWERRF